MDLEEIKRAATENKTNDDNVEFDNNYKVDNNNNSDEVFFDSLKKKASIVANAYLTNWFENRKDYIDKPKVLYWLTKKNIVTKESLEDYPNEYLPLFMDPITIEETDKDYVLY